MLPLTAGSRRRADTAHQRAPAPVSGSATGGTALLQVQFKRRESERAQAARKRSHAYLQKQFDDEAWVAMTYHDDCVRIAGGKRGVGGAPPSCPARDARRAFLTPLRLGLYDKLFAEDDRSIVLPTTKAEYINALIPLPVAVGEYGPAPGPQVAHSAR